VNKIMADASIFWIQPAWTCIIYPKRYVLKKNVKIQILSKIHREGWIRNRFNGVNYFFRSPDAKMALEFEVETTSPPHKIHFFIWKYTNTRRSAGYETLISTTYKYYIKYGSEMILMDALM